MCLNRYSSKEISSAVYRCKCISVPGIELALLVKTDFGTLILSDCATDRAVCSVEWGTGAGIKGVGCGVDRARWYETITWPCGSFAPQGVSAPTSTTRTTKRAAQMMGPMRKPPSTEVCDPQLPQPRPR